MSHCHKGYVYLRNIAVDDAVPVIHYKVIQFLVRDVIERAVLPRERQAIVTAHLLKQKPSLLLFIQGGEEKEREGYLYISTLRLSII